MKEISAQLSWERDVRTDGPVQLIIEGVHALQDHIDTIVVLLREVVLIHEIILPCLQRHDCLTTESAFYMTIRMTSMHVSPAAQTWYAPKPAPTQKNARESADLPEAARPGVPINANGASRNNSPVDIPLDALATLMQQIGHGFPNI